MAELLPCPFCGGQAKVKTIVPMSLVVCKNCGSMGKIVADQYEEGDGIEEAVKAWNNRRNRMCEGCTHIFSTRLRAERKKRGYSVDYMCRKLFMSRSTYYYYEQGKLMPNAGDIEEISNILGVKVNYLLGE